jgi:hypothetical protein
MKMISRIRPHLGFGTIVRVLCAFVVVLLYGLASIADVWVKLRILHHKGTKHTRQQANKPQAELGKSKHNHLLSEWMDLRGVASTCY